MNGKQIIVERCACGGAAARMLQNGSLWLRCGQCERETSKTELRTEAALDALINEWNSPAK